MAKGSRKKFIEGYEEWSRELEEAAKGVPQTDDEYACA